MIQKSLFDDERTFRKSDPPTSKAAGREIAPRLNELQQRVLALVADRPGWTANELVGGLAQAETLRKRFHELQRLGKIEVAGQPPLPRDRQGSEDLAVRFGSLFSGIGGLDLGLERAGMECAWQVEIDDYATRVLEKHWPNVPRWRDIADFIADAECGIIGGGLQQEGELRECEAGSEQVADISGGKCDIARSRRGVDLICGGFPCQPVSVAGRRDGMADKRWLWPQFRSVIRILRPNYVLVENVPGLLSADAGRAFGGILRDLAQLGYDAEWQVLPAAAFGAPHLRKRIFIVAHAEHDGSPAEQWPGREEEAGGMQKSERCITSDASQQPERKPNHQTDSQPEEWNARQISISGDWRSTQPTIRRGDHGVSFELDFIGRLNDEQSYDPKANPTGVWANIADRFLRYVWKYRQLAATSPGLYEQQVLAGLPKMSHGYSHGGWYVGARIEKDKKLRDLWREFQSIAQPSQDMRQKLLKRIRAAKCPQTVGRVDRLRCLGNAVVPQVAEWIGRQIMAAAAVG